MVAAASSESAIEMAFYKAAQTGDLPTLKKALSEQPELLDEPGPGGWPALHLAAHFGQKDCLKELIARGADLKLRSANPENNLALHAAAAGGRLQTAEYLIRMGSEVNSTYAKGFTALHVAAFNGSIEVVVLLINSGADVNLRTDDQQTPLMLAESRGHASLVSLLQAAGAAG